MKNPDNPFYFRICCALLSLLALGYMVFLGKEILTPLTFAGLLFMLLIPPAQFLEKRVRLARGMAAGITVLSLLGLLIGLVYLLEAQISDLSSDLPHFKKQIFISFSEIQKWISLTFHINYNRQMSYINSAWSSVLNSGSLIVGNTLLGLTSMILSIVFVLLYTFFFLLYRSLIKRFLIGIFKDGNTTLVNEIISQVQKIIRKYITGLLLEMVLVIGAVSIIFWSLGIPYPFLLGLLTGLLNLIPYVGIASALIISVLITVATASGIKILLVIIALVGVHLIDSNILLPVIVGSKVKINALMTIIGVVLGELIWSIPGMFLSIPIMAILKIIFDRIESLKPWGILLGEDEKLVKGKVSSQ